MQSSNTVLFLKLTCSTLQSAVILDSSSILIRILFQKSLSNLCSSKLTSLCERAKHLEARHRGAYVTFLKIYIIKVQWNFDDYIYLCFLQSQSNYLCISV